jgi:uncharacterized protein (DUF433 family)
MAPGGVVRTGSPFHPLGHTAWGLTMTRNELLQRVSINPDVCFGRPCIRGTRIWVSLLLDLLASGMAESELLSEYPQLAHEDVLAALAFGAEMARERVFAP